MTVVETLLDGLPTSWQVTDVYVGANWILSVVRRRDGLQQAGVAATPHHITPDARFQLGHYVLDSPAEIIAGGLRSTDITEAAVGLATLNALNQIDEARLTTDDAADWLSAHSAGKGIAVFGRFPFIEAEIRPYARQVWVFEQNPEADELDDTAIQSVLPQADVVAITSSAVINHTIDLILPYTRPNSTVVLLGPSTPLAEKLFDSGIDALFGVRVVDLERVRHSVMAGDGFQKMVGLQRVAMFKRP